MDNIDFNNQLSDQSQSEGLVQIKDFILTCFGKWYWFLLSVIVVCALAVLYILRTPSSYERSTEVMIKNDSRTRTLSREFDVPDMALLNTTSSVRNEIIVIQSPSIIEEVVRRLDLNHNYVEDGLFHGISLYSGTLPINVQLLDLDERTSASLKVDMAEGGQVELSEFMIKGERAGGRHERVSGSLTDTLDTPLGKVLVLPSLAYNGNEERHIGFWQSSIHSATDRYKLGLSASLVNKTADVITLSFTDVVPARAEDFLNTLVEVYNEKWVLDKNQIATSTSEFINDRLAVIESELGNVDTDISQYKSANMLPDVEMATSMYLNQNNEATKALAELNNQIYTTNYIRQYIMSEANTFQLLPASTGVIDAGLQAQISEYNTQMLRRNNLVANSSTSNPLVVNLDKTLEDLRAAIVTTIDNQLVALNQQKKSLQQQASSASARIQANPTQAKYLLSVERKQTVMESLYLYLLQQREQNELSQTFTAYNTRIVTPPRGSLYPVAPRKVMIMLVALLIGLMIPAAVLYIKEATNTRIRGKKDIEGLSLPFIGEIPQAIESKKYAASNDAKLILVKPGKRDVVNEAFRVMRTNLEFMTKKDGDSSVVMVTSFNPGSGKSFITVNLAISFAIKNKKVLVIDGDLRHASASTYMDCPKVGISSYLGGDNVSIDDILYVDEKNPTLSFLPVGVIPPNPTELLEEARFDTLIAELRKRFDLIFIDCPPINMVADSQIIERCVDRTVFIVRAGLLEKSMLPELESLYKEHKFKNMALVLNGTEVLNTRYGYKYGYKYGYHYGYGYGYHYGNEEKTTA